MTDKITSIAELKEWAEGEIEQTKDKIMKFKREEWAEGTWERLQGYLSGLVLLLEKINELEAGVRERIELFSHEKTSEELITLIDCEHLLPLKDFVPLCDKSGHDCNPFACKLFGQAFCEKRLEELRRLLSGSEPRQSGVEGERNERVADGRVS